MAKKASARKKAAQKKVRELVKKGYRLRDGAGSDTYRGAARQKKMGTRGTGKAAEKVANQAKRQGRKRKK